MFEHHFTCPYCWETISMVLDASVKDTQQYVEDCEVCCRPIEVSYRREGEDLVDFYAQAMDGIG
ncbi:MAG: CPXCG motif-containing cysteine-rich protein [Deltaproteobacteria bacterium]|nr:MAG: CPXCG motif-containing cysteine-rich protein [Deltaproteobacteria bacterium]